MLTAEELKTAINGKVLLADYHSGQVWRIQFRADGYFFFNLGNFSDSGKWSVKESQVCTEGQKSGSNCGDYRMKDGNLYLKRPNGEVLKFTTK
jgi:hypothetical protein